MSVAPSKVEVVIEIPVQLLLEAHLSEVSGCTCPYNRDHAAAVRRQIAQMVDAITTVCPECRGVGFHRATDSGTAECCKTCGGTQRILPRPT